MRSAACALFWFGVVGACLAMLGAGVGVTLAAVCWGLALTVMAGVMLL